MDVFWGVGWEMGGKNVLAGSGFGDSMQVRFGLWPRLRTMRRRKVILIRALRSLSANLVFKVGLQLSKFNRQPKQVPMS